METLKEKILDNLTVGLLTHDKSSTFTNTFENLKKQEFQPKKIIIIKNICPVYEAVFKLLNDVKTEFVIILDDDIEFLYNDSLKLMIEEIQKYKADEIVFRLRDPIFGKIKGIRIYRTSEVLSIIKTLKISKDWDVDINKHIQKEKSLVIDFIIATHHKEWSDLDLYWKMFSISKKLFYLEKKEGFKYLNRHINTLCEISKNKQFDSFIILYAFCGLIDGLRDEKKQLFLSYEDKYNNEVFGKFKKIIDSFIELDIKRSF